MVFNFHVCFRHWSFEKIRLNYYQKLALHNIKKKNKLNFFLYFIKLILAKTLSNLKNIFIKIVRDNLITKNLSLLLSAPKPVIVEFENKKWEISSVNWYPARLLCGSNNGAVAILDPETHEILSAIFVHK